MTTESQEKYLRLKEVCNRYNVNEKTVYRLVRARLIPYGKFGKVLIFPEKYLEWWLRDSKKALTAWWNNNGLCPIDMEDNHHDSQEIEEERQVARRLLL